MVKVAIGVMEDGRWLADAIEYPGVSVYGATEKEAIARVKVLLYRTLADQIEQEELNEQDSKSPSSTVRQ